MKIVVLESDNKPHIYQVIKETSSSGIVKQIIGDKIVEIPARLASFSYKDYMGKEQIVYKTDAMDPFSESGYQYYGKIAGNGSVCQLYHHTGWQFGTPLWKECPDTDMGFVIAHDILSRAGKTMKGKKDFPWMIIIIVVGVLIFSIIAMKTLSNKKSIPTSNQTTTILK